MWSSGWLKSRHVVCSKRLSYCWTIRHLPCFPPMVGQGTCWSVTTWTVIVCGCKGWRGLALDAAWRDAAFSGNPSPSFFSHSSFVCVACRAAVRWRWSHKHGIWPIDYSGTQWMAGEDQAPAKAFFLYYLHTHTKKMLLITVYSTSMWKLPIVWETGGLDFPWQPPFVLFPYA